MSYRYIIRKLKTLRHATEMPICLCNILYGIWTYTAHIGSIVVNFRADMLQW